MIQLSVKYPLRRGFLLSTVAKVEWDERTDTIIMRDVGVRSTVEIAKELGVDPLAVRRRVQELLDAVDVLTVDQQRMKLMVQLRDLVNKANERLELIGDRDFGPVLSATTQAVKTQLGELARMEKADETKITALNALRVQELLRLVSAVVETSVQEIAEDYGLDQDALLAVFQSKLIEEAERKDNEL